MPPPGKNSLDALVYYCNAQFLTQNIIRLVLFIVSFHVNVTRMSDTKFVSGERLKGGYFLSI